MEGSCKILYNCVYIRSQCVHKVSLCLCVLKACIPSHIWVCLLISSTKIVPIHCKSFTRLTGRIFKHGRPCICFLEKLRCGPSSGGCQSTVSSLPFIAQRVTASCDISTYEANPPPLPSLLPDHASPPLSPPSLSLRVGNMLQAERQGRG